MRRAVPPGASGKKTAELVWKCLMMRTGPGRALVRFLQFFVCVIVTAVEKKHLLLFNLWGDDSPHRP